MAEPAPDKRPPRIAPTVLSVLGTVAGVTFALYLVGALFEFRRLKTLGLPADQPVSSMPHDLLLIIGVRSLLVPVGATILTSAAFFLASEVAGRYAAAGLVVLASLAVVFIVRAGSWTLRWEHATLVAAAAVTVTAGLLANRRYTWRWRTHVAVPAVMLLFAVGVAYHHTMRPPVHFDYATVVLTHGTVRGFYIGRTSDSIYIAPAVAPSGREPNAARPTCRFLDVILTTEVARMSFERGKATTAQGPVERRRCDVLRHSETLQTPRS